MDDFHANPTKTGLMFVPLGPMSYCCVTRPREHLAKLGADIGVDARDLVPAPRTERGWLFRRLLAQIGARFGHLRRETTLPNRASASSVSPL